MSRDCIVSLVRLLLLLSVMAPVVGCSTNEPLPAFEPPAGTPKMDAQADGDARVMRFCDAFFGTLEAQSAQRTQIDIGHGWIRRNGSVVRLQGPELHVANRKRPPAAAIRVACSARQYNAVRLKMRGSAGTSARLSWRSDLEPDADAHPGVRVPVIPDNASHEYTFNLHFDSAPFWQGTIEELSFDFGDAPGAVSIEAIELLFLPPKGPDRLLLDTDTHEAVWGTLPAWTVAVPENAILEVYAGLAAREGSLLGDGVHFEIRAAGVDGTPLRLEDAALHVTRDDQSQWHRLEADLSQYEGKTLTLEFLVLPGASREGDYAFWGSPMVYSRGASGGPTGAAKTPTPVILISCDTLRADHVSCYGYARKTTPHIDALAADSVLFEQCVTPEAWTPPAHMSVLTGLDPIHHGLGEFVNLSEEIDTLPEHLRAAGYLTAGHVGHNWWLLPSRGFAQGFDTYTLPVGSGVAMRDVFTTHAVAKHWLDAVQGAPFFLFLHNYDIHSRFSDEFESRPYAPPRPEFAHFSKTFSPAPDFRRPELPDGGPKGTAFLAAANLKQISITDRELEYMLALYDDAILGVDAAVGQLLDDLRTRGIYDDALIILMSDHGEDFGEHGTYIHMQIYEHTVHVPLIIKLPHGANAGSRVKGLVSLTDIMPTVLDVLGMAVPSGLDGRSLMPLIEKDAHGRDEVYLRCLSNIGMRTPDWKLVNDTTKDVPELYYLPQDPAETHNRYEAESELGGGMLKRVRDYFGSAQYGWRFRFIGGTTPNTIRLRAFASAPLAAYIFEGEHQEGNDDMLWFDGGRQSITVTMQAAVGDEDTLLILPSFEQNLVVEAEGDGAFHVVPAQTTVSGPNTTWKTTLVPGAHETAPEPAPAGVTTVHVTYVPPPADVSAAPAPTPQQMEELNAIGYLQGASQAKRSRIE